MFREIPEYSRFSMFVAATLMVINCEVLTAVDGKE